MIERLAFVEEPLTEMPPGSGDRATVFATSDGHVAAFWAPPDGGMRFIWDDRVGPSFDGLVVMSDGRRLFWSEDDRHLAYIGFRGSTQFVGRDGDEGPAFELVSRSVPPAFSRDGSRLVYGAQVEGTYRLIVDGAVGDDELAPVAATLSPDGRHLAYVAFDAGHRVVVDRATVRAKVKIRNSVGTLQFSPDSHRFAFYEIGRGEGRWVVDSVDGPWVNDAPPLDLSMLRGVGKLRPPLPARFSPDSSKFAYWADVKEKGVAVIEDGVAGPLLRKAGAPVYSSDSRHLAYGGEAFSGRIGMVRDGVIEREWPPGKGGEPVFSADSSRLAYVIEREEGGFLRKRRVFDVIVDTDSVFEYSAVDASRWPVFSPDSQHLAWWTQDAVQGVVYVDGDARIRGREILSEPILSVSGHLIAAIKLDGGWTVQVDDRPGPLAGGIRERTPGHAGGGPADPSKPHFCVSPSGDQVAWAGSFDGGVRPIVDDQLGPTYDEVFSATFDSYSAATWLARRGTRRSA